MYKTDRQGMIEQVQQFANVIRTFYIIGFFFMGIGIFLSLLSILFGSLSNIAIDLPLHLIRAIGVVTLAILIFFLIIQIFFFRYFGKVIKQTQAGIYTSTTPALINLILVGLGVLSTIKDFLMNEGFPLVSLVINLILIYLIYGVYNGLKTIEKNRFFDYAASTATTTDYSPVINQTETTADNATNKVDNHNNGSWIKED